MFSRIIVHPTLAINDVFSNLQMQVISSPSARGPTWKQLESSKQTYLLGDFNEQNSWSAFHTCSEGRKK